MMNFGADQYDTEVGGAFGSGSEVWVLRFRVQGSGFTAAAL